MGKSITQRTELDNTVVVMRLTKAQHAPSPERGHLKETPSKVTMYKNVREQFAVPLSSLNRLSDYEY